MATIYRICRRLSLSFGTWYVVQKKRLFGWHTYNIIFRDVSTAQQFIDDIDYELKFGYMVESPLMWDTHKRRYIEQYPCKSYSVKIR